jgi:hypothetical protein
MGIQKPVKNEGVCTAIFSPEQQSLPPVFQPRELDATFTGFCVALIWDLLLVRKKSQIRICS